MRVMIRSTVLQGGPALSFELLVFNLRVKCFIMLMLIHLHCNPINFDKSLYT